MAKIDDGGHLGNLFILKFVIKLLEIHVIPQYYPILMYFNCYFYNMTPQNRYGHPGGGQTAIFWTKISQNTCIWPI